MELNGALGKSIPLLWVPSLPDIRSLLALLLFLSKQLLISDTLLLFTAVLLPLTSTLLLCIARFSSEFRALNIGGNTENPPSKLLDDIFHTPSQPGLQPQSNFTEDRHFKLFLLRHYDLGFS